MKTAIDVLRSEKRFLLLPERLPSFLKEISSMLGERTFSENRVARTIYFNNDDYPIPWGVSVKARKYLPDFSEKIIISPEEIYRVEIKSSGEEDVREKIQRELPLAEAISFISEKLEIDLRPYMVDEYRRKHLVSGENPDLLRLTIDQQVRYGLFTGLSSPADWIGNEEFVRIEIKAAPWAESSEEYQRVLQLVTNYQPLPVISKREHAFSFAGLVIDKKGNPLRKETTDCEIEAKFLVQHPDPAALLLELKKHFKGSQIDYMVAPHYSYTQEGASINHYWSRYDKKEGTVDGTKLMFIGQKVRPVFKEETEILPEPYGLDCLLERHEVKGEPFIYTSQSFDRFLRKAERLRGGLKYIGYLHRSRRAFWPENRKSGRIYHISLDCCQSFEGKVMWQLEVEYTGRYVDRLENISQEEAKVAIRQEVAELAQETRVFCGDCLIPTTLTKFDWLRGG